MKTPLKVTLILSMLAYTVRASIPANFVRILPQQVSLAELDTHMPSYSPEKPFSNQDYSEWTVDQAIDNITTPNQAVDWLESVFSYEDGTPETTLEKAVKLGVMDCGGEAYAQAQLLFEDGYNPYLILLGSKDHTYTGLIYKDQITGLWGSSSTRTWADKQPIYESVSDLVNDMKPNSTIFEQWGVVKIPEHILILKEAKDLKFEITYEMMPYEINNPDHPVMEALE